MAQFIHPNKIHPERSRAWIMEEKKLPYHPNSTSHQSRRTLVVNPVFQQPFHEPIESVNEEDMEPTIMKAPQVQCPRRVTKRENMNVVRESEWDVKDSLGRRTSLNTVVNRPVAALVGVACLISVASLVLALLIVSNTIEARKCSCRDTEGKPTVLIISYSMSLNNLFPPGRTRFISFETIVFWVL